MRTKVFKNGNSQAIRIPSEFKLDCSTVEIVCEGDKLVIYPNHSDPWAEFKEFLKRPISKMPDRTEVSAQERDWS